MKVHSGRPDSLKNYLSDCLRREIESFQNLLEEVEGIERREAQDIREALRRSGKKIHILNRFLASFN